MNESKPWWQSKTILSGIAIAIQGLYELAVKVGPSFGYQLPEIPESVQSAIGAILGTMVIRGRVTADKAIQ